MIYSTTLCDYYYNYYYCYFTIALLHITDYYYYYQVTPTVNVERLWSLVSEQTRAYYKAWYSLVIVWYIME